MTLDMTLLHCITAGQGFPCTGSVLLKPVACAALHIAALDGLALAGSGRYKVALRLQANGQKLKGAAKKGRSSREKSTEGAQRMKGKGGKSQRGASQRRGAKGEKQHTIFPTGALKDLLLVCVLADQAVNGDLLALTYPMTSGHGLQIILQQHTHTLKAASLVLCNDTSRFRATGYFWCYCWYSYGVTYRTISNCVSHSYLLYIYQLLTQ